MNTPIDTETKWIVSAARDGVEFIRQIVDTEERAKRLVIARNSARTRGSESWGYYSEQSSNIATV